VWRLLPVLAAVALLATACGKPGPKSYSEVKSRACFVGKKVKVTPPPASDFVATTALGGAFRVVLGANFVTVSFGSNPSNAVTLDDVYRDARAKNVGIDDVLRLQGNAVMLWHAHPSNDDLSVVQGCLR